MCSTLRVLLVLTAVAALFAPVPLQAQPVAVVRIVEVDNSQFPTIDVTVSYNSEQGQQISPAPSFTVQIDDVAVEVAEVRTRQLPVAVSVVVDLSARMSDRGAPFQSRFVMMQQLADELIDRLTIDLDPQRDDDGLRASLTVMNQTVTVAHELTYDLGAVGNTINNSNPQVRFTAEELDTTAADAPYPLAEALQSGLDELQKADANQPQVLVLFAAGDPTQPLDTTQLRQSFAEARNAKRPIQLLVFSFGSDQTGSFEKFPADPNGLQQLVEELGGTFVPLGNQLADEQTRRVIDEQFAAILQRAEHYVLRVTANNVPSGLALLRVTDGSSEDSSQLDISKVPPRFNVVVDSRNFQDRVQITISTEFQQAPITQVEYLLGNRSLAPTLEQGPDFKLELNAYDPAFQQRFPPGEYELTAAARDANGNESRSEQPIIVTVFAPPTPQGPLEELQRSWWLLLVAVGVVALGAVGFVLVRQRRSNAIPAPSSSPLGDDDPTRKYNAEDPTMRYAEPDSDATARYSSDDEEKTARYVSTVAQPEVRWFVEIIEGDETNRIELDPAIRHYDIGRETQRRKPLIALKNSKVSRDHAKLELFHNGLDLIPNETENGTFLGDGDSKKELEPHKPVALQSGDVFWLSPLVKVRVESVTNKHDN